MYKVPYLLVSRLLEQDTLALSPRLWFCCKELLIFLLALLQTLENVLVHAGGDGGDAARGRDLPVDPLLDGEGRHGQLTRLQRPEQSLLGIMGPSPEVKRNRISIIFDPETSLSPQGDVMSRTAGLESVVDLSLGQREGAVAGLHEGGVDVAAEAVDVVVLGGVVKAMLSNSDAGEPGELLQQVGQRVDFELDPGVPGLVEDEVGDGGRGLDVVGEDVERREVAIVSAEKLDDFPENILHVCVVMGKLLGEEVGVPGVKNAHVLVSNRNGVKGRDESVPCLQIYIMKNIQESG